MTNKRAKRFLCILYNPENIFLMDSQKKFCFCYVLYKNYSFIYSISPTFS